jgi:death-on-curing protein
VAIRIHEEALRAHGGLPGIRDRNLVSASAVRALFKYMYEDEDLAACAAAYGFAFARNHPFHDGNKRTAFGVLTAFLVANGHVIEADTEECIRVILDVAAGRLGEDGLASWVRRRMRPV